jgi:hypothetical protein
MYVNQMSLIALVLVVAILATLYIMRRRVRLGKRVGKF